MLKQEEFSVEEKLELFYNFFKKRAEFYLDVMTSRMADEDYSYDYQLNDLKEFETSIFECEKYLYDIEKTLEIFDLRKDEILINS